ncbi:Copper-sensitive operon repressor [Thalassovita autumnalis]|uniref:Copper-sensitive operon repressor n=1 Tax=Thalassovita autumnalis TaxID=2072972 RepID=A0A0P1F5W6_9RHOB|nr:MULTISPECIES: metal-sensing transcriptional repressor [Thalassovita]CUH63256.1 Copper-sensitive operon repressor [Thalassovita autumnalis]CUH72002.1 Copper-sensitive operon repressor [Thalassovita autumnalis]
MTHPHRHESHPKIISRLNRANGHLSAVIRMIEEGKPCREVAQQLQAVESALRNAKQTLIHDHMDHCLEEGTLEEQRAELKAISRYL